MDAIDLTVTSGECFSLLGPSGCGSTPVHVYLPADALRVLAGPALVSDAVPLAS